MTFDAKKTVKYWLDSAEYDLETGRSLLESKRFPYALFFAHLALEKTLKAVVVKTTKKHAPFTHSLIQLAQITDMEIPESMLDKLAEYMEFHLESRYPDEKRSFRMKCTEEFTKKEIKETEEIFKWLKSII